MIVKTVGILFVLAGVVWCLQGINVLPGSFMSGDPQWVVNGLIAMFAGAVIFWLGNRQ